MKTRLAIFLAAAAIAAASPSSAAEETAAEETAAEETAAVSCPTGETWSVIRFQREFCGYDSWEPFNRTMFGVFDVCMNYLVDPFCYVYSSIFPKPLINGIDNFSENLEEPARIFSNLSIGEWRASWDDTKRFLINSTLGIGGLFNPAEEWYGLVDSQASFTDTLAYYDIPAGPPLALPFVPRTSIRGTVGYAIDYAFDLKTWIDIFVPNEFFLGYTWGLVPNKAPVWRGAWEDLFYHAEDRYGIYMPVMSGVNEFNLRPYTCHYNQGQLDNALLRMESKEHPEGGAERAELERRARDCVREIRPPVHASASRPADLCGQWREIPGFAPRGPSLDSLRALCFTPLGDDDFWWERRSIFNRDFSKSIEERDVEIAEGLPEATYSFVPRREGAEGGRGAERLTFVLPGIGSGRTAAPAVAMAELLNGRGHAVVICDSVFHHESARSVNRGILPGYLPADMRRFAEYLGKIVEDLRADGLVHAPEISIVGWSMGGFTTASMAALDDAGKLPFHVSRFVAINPPVSMHHAVAPFAKTIEDTRSWSFDKAKRMFTEVASSLFSWGNMDHPRYDPANPPTDEVGDPWDYSPNITEAQAEYLLGQTMKVVFLPLVTDRHRIAPFPWIGSSLDWFHRNDFYDEIGDLTMEKYISQYVTTCYPGLSLEQINAAADMRCLEKPLVRNTRFAIIHTWNDPLETDDDRRYLDRTYGWRITWFADGAHCGYFHTKPFEDELFLRLGE